MDLMQDMSMKDPLLMLDDVSDCGSVMIVGGECEVVSDGVYRGIVHSA